MHKSPVKIWLKAIRPKTLYASVAPVVLGTAMAFGDGIHDFLIASLALIGAVCIQILTNLVNDYCDCLRGADNIHRIGPTRVMQAGLVTNKQMLSAIFILLLIIVGISYFLVLRGGIPIILIGILSIVSGILYTAGPIPLGYVGLGELFVLIFFGPVAVGGTYYVQSLEINTAVILAGLGPGFLSAAILIVNNLRDIETDAQSGKKTLAVRFGAAFAKQEYFFCITSACLVPVMVYSYIQDHLIILTSVTVIYFAIPVIDVVYSHRDGPSLNASLANTGKLLMIYCTLFGLGWII